MKRTLCFLLVFAGVSMVAVAQQDPLYSQYLNNPFVLNPAYAGLTNNLNLAASFRQQWAGFEGSPKTINGNGHISLFDNKMGAGLMFISDKVGYTTTTEVLGSYSYRIRVDEDKILSFGLQGGMANYQLDNNKLNPQDKTDPLFQGTISETKPSFGAGVILKSDRFFVGLSVPRMLKSTLQTAGLQPTLYTQHFYLMGSYIFFLTERLRLKPSILYKKVSGAPGSVDLNASLIFFENYSAGLLTRNFNTYGLFLHAYVGNSFRIGYVFEVPTGKSVGANYTTHEVTLGFRLNALSFHDNKGIMSF
jgi:type IX secretion system PorP/SprF family membrane protein